MADHVKYTGISYNKKHGRWVARVGVNQKVVHLGEFKTAKAAALTRDHYIVTRKLNNKLNFPELKEGDYYGRSC